MASTDVDYQPAGQKKNGIAAHVEGFRKFMWDGDKNEFMGRTGSSWGKIGIFYLIFYSCLAAFFAAFLAGLLSLMDDKFPNQTGMNSLIKGNPGMGFRPQIDVEKTLIKFTQGTPNAKTFKSHTDQITKFLKSYEDEAVNKDAKDSGGPEPADCSGTDDRDEKQACRFPISKLGKTCVAPHYGFDEGQPCVLLKLNKVYGWEPELWGNSSDISNSEVAGNWAPENLTVTCEGEDDAGKDSVGSVEFYPSNGFEAKYFPYKNQAGYRSPLVFAKFTSPTAGTVIQVWCKVWAKNVYHDKNDKAGSVHFEIQVD